jgi:hypothetical protein
MEIPPILMAVWERSAERVAQLARKDPSAVNDVSTGKAPLHAAAEPENDEIGRVLLDHGADPNVRDYLGTMPLHLAALRGAASFCRLLIERGAAINAYDGACVSPLGYALFSFADGAGDCAKLLRAAGAAEDLITAIYSGDDELIAALLRDKAGDERHRRQLARSIPELLGSWKKEALRAWTPETTEEGVLRQVVAKHLPSLDLLLARGAQMDLPGIIVNQTALFEAICESPTQDILIRPLLERPPRPDAAWAGSRNRPLCTLSRRRRAAGIRRPLKGLEKICSHCTRLA